MKYYKIGILVTALAFAPMAQANNTWDIIGGAVFGVILANAWNSNHQTVVYQQPQVIYQQPQVVYQQPQVIYQQPQVVYQQPQVRQPVYAWDHYCNCERVIGWQ